MTDALHVTYTGLITIADEGNGTEDSLIVLRSVDKIFMAYNRLIEASALEQQDSNGPGTTVELFARSAEIDMGIITDFDDNNTYHIVAKVFRTAVEGAGCSAKTFEDIEFAVRCVRRKVTAAIEIDRQTDPDRVDQIETTIKAQEDAKNLEEVGSNVSLPALLAKGRGNRTEAGHRTGRGTEAEESWS